MDSASRAAPVGDPRDTRDTRIQGLEFYIGPPSFSVPGGGGVVLDVMTHVRVG